jgi:hypothetical protein
MIDFGTPSRFEHVLDISTLIKLLDPISSMQAVHKTLTFPLRVGASRAARYVASSHRFITPPFEDEGAKTILRSVGHKFTYLPGR